MRKVLTIARSEFLTAVTSRAFLIGVMLVPSLMFGSIFVQRAIGRRVDRDDRRFAVLDHTGRLYPIVALAAEVWNQRQTALAAGTDSAQATGRLPQTGARFMPEQVQIDGRSIDQVRLELSRRIASRELFAFVEIPASAVQDEGGGVLRYHSNHPGYTPLPTWLDTVLNQAIVAERLRAANVDVALLRTLQQRLPLEPRGLIRQESDGRLAEGEKVDRIKTLAIPGVLMALMFTIVLSSASPLLNSVMEEKMTRISEVLLGSVTPFELMLGKLAGSLVVSLVLAAVYVGGGLVAASYWGYADALPVAIAGWFALYLVMAILMYGSVFMAIGAACTDLKDAQGMMTPVMLMFVIPFLVWQPVMQAPESTFAVVVSLIPVATPMLMLLRLSLHPGPPFWQVLLSVLIAGGTCLLFVWSAGRIFRTGILMQGKSASFREMLRWVRA